MIKHKQPQKVWVDDGTEFLGAFKTLCSKRGIHLYSTFSEKNSAFAERNIRSLKNIIYRYLEEKWTYSYITNLDQFVKTINSRVNRITKLAPNKVTKKDVPRLVSLTVETRRSQIPNFTLATLFESLKRKKLSEKDTSNRSRTKFLKLPVFRRSIHLHILLLIPIKKASRAGFICQNYN